MGLWHDSTGVRVGDDRDGAFVNYAFAVFCVPDDPDPSYYSEVISIWKDELHEKMRKDESEEDFEGY